MIKYLSNCNLSVFKICSLYVLDINVITTIHTNYNYYFIFLKKYDRVKILFMPRN